MYKRVWYFCKECAKEEWGGYWSKGRSEPREQPTKENTRIMRCILHPKKVK